MFYLLFIQLSKVINQYHLVNIDVIKISVWRVLYTSMAEKYRNQEFIDNVTKRIEEIRLQKGIVQEDIVDRTGFTLKQVWLMLSGKSNFAISNLEAIAKALEVHPRDLLDFDVPIHKGTPLRKDRKGK